MKRPLERLTLTVIIVLICGLNASPQERRPIQKERKADTDFTSVGRGEAEDADGVTLAFTAYKTKAGAGHMLLHKEFGSAAEAQTYFKRQTDTAVKILETGPARSRAGYSCEVRALGLFRSSTPDKTTHAILWTCGSNFYKIVSDSLSDAKVLEHQIFSSKETLSVP